MDLGMHQVCIILSKLQKQSLKILTSWKKFLKSTRLNMFYNNKKRRIYKEPAIYP